MKRLNNDIAAYRESLFFSVGSTLHKKINTWATVFVYVVIFIAAWQQVPQSWFASPAPVDYKLPLSFAAFCIYFLVYVLLKKDTHTFII